MTDAEMIKKCADKMGVNFKVDIGPPHTKGAKLIEAEIESAKRAAYDPLHDDAQAMALMVKMRLNAAYSWDEGMWSINIDPEFKVGSGFSSSLNRAIVEYVANLP